MRWWQSHVSGEDLLLMEDGELGRRRLARVRRHLRDCRDCGGRRQTLLAALAGLTSAYRDAQAPDAEAQTSRARLLARLAREAERPVRLGDWSEWEHPQRIRALHAAAGLAVAAVLAVLVMQPADPTGDDARFVAPTAAQGPALPRRDLTPGAVRRVSVEEVCGGEDDVARPAVAASVARRVFEDYGADYRRAAEYELDFLITPELGGTADALNLWPQPYEATRWNAHVKDELEQLFRRLVCDGTIDISTAQREMATDWIGAYRRYFETERPRRDAAPRGGQNG